MEEILPLRHNLITEVILLRYFKSTVHILFGFFILLKVFSNNKKDINEFAMEVFSLYTIHYL